MKELMNYLKILKDLDKIPPRVLAAFIFAGFGTPVLFSLTIPMFNLEPFRNVYGIILISVAMFSVFILFIWLLGVPTSCIRGFFKKRHEIKYLDRLTDSQTKLLVLCINDAESSSALVRKKYFYWRSDNGDFSVGDLYLEGIVVNNPDSRGPHPGIIPDHIWQSLKMKKLAESCWWRLVMYKIKKFLRWLIV